MDAGDIIAGLRQLKENPERKTAEARNEFQKMLDDQATLFERIEVENARHQAALDQIKKARERSPELPPPVQSHVPVAAAILTPSVASPGKPQELVKTARPNLVDVNAAAQFFPGMAAQFPLAVAVDPKDKDGQRRLGYMLRGLPTADLAAHRDATAVVRDYFKPRVERSNFNRQAYAAAAAGIALIDAALKSIGTTPPDSGPPLARTRSKPGKDRGG